jgi:hypothetical protein
MNETFAPVARFTVDEYSVIAPPLMPEFEKGH